MPMDYPVFEPHNKELAEIIVRILEKRGYQAEYQRSYPQHTVFIKVDEQEEANNISKIIEGFMGRFKKQKAGGIISYKYDQSITKLGRLIPETPKKEHKNLIEEIQEKIEKEDW